MLKHESIEEVEDDGSDFEGNDRDDNEYEVSARIDVMEQSDLSLIHI